VICSGEALPVELAQRFLSRNAAELHNLYGPTEASVDVSAWQCVPDATLRTVPIGYPIANTQLYILAASLEPQPPGVPGQLYIGGVGLARGYLGRPALTAEKFIPHPFSDVPGARLYATGDLARYQADGSIEFLGRLDHQVKIRGYRIELGEIEHALAGHPSVSGTVVVPRQVPAGDDILVAYVLAPPGARPTPSELRDHLRRRLPDYMIPRAFVFLDALPLSPNGKVDRQKLPPPELTRAGLKTEWVAPRGPLEAELAAIWKDVLNLDRVGANDNFFELGGHSLLATRVLSRLNHTFAVELPLSSIFESPTVAELALAVAFAQVNKSGAEDLTELLRELEQLPDEAVQKQLGGE
jgi:acyl carrier protein